MGGTSADGLQRLSTPSIAAPILLAQNLLSPQTPCGPQTNIVQAKIVLSGCLPTLVPTMGPRFLTILARVLFEIGISFATDPNGGAGSWPRTWRGIRTRW